LTRILVATDAWHPQVNGVVRTYDHLAQEVQAWLEQHYGSLYKDYCERTARFFDAQGLALAALDKKQRSRPEPVQAKSR